MKLDITEQNFSPLKVVHNSLGVNGESCAGAYRFGFNGQEKDNEIYGEGNLYTAQFWEYDSRIGRRWNLDPVVKTHESPFACFANNPIWFVDFDGKDTMLVNSGRISNNKLEDQKNDFDVLVDVSRKEYRNGKINYKDDGSLRKRHDQLKITKDAFTFKTSYGDCESEKSSKATRMLLTFNYEGYKDADNVYKFLVHSASYSSEFSYFGVWTNDPINKFGPKVHISSDFEPHSDDFGGARMANYLNLPTSELIFYIHNHPPQQSGQPDVTKPSGLKNKWENNGNTDIRHKEKYGNPGSIFRIYAEGEYHDY